MNYLILIFKPLYNILEAKFLNIICKYKINYKSTAQVIGSNPKFIKNHGYFVHVLFFVIITFFLNIHLSIVF